MKPPSSFHLLFWILLLLFPLGQLSLIFLPWPSVRIYWHDIIVLLLIIGYYSQITTYIRKYFFLKAFVAFTVFSLGLQLYRFPPELILLGSMYFGRLLAYTGVFLLILHTLKNKDFIRLLRGLLLVITLTLGFGFVQYLFFPQLESVFILGWDRHSYRMVSTWLDPNFLAVYLVLAQVFVWNLIHTHLKQLHSNLTIQTLGLGLLAAGLFFGLLLTYSRIGYLSFATAVLVFFIRIKQWWMPFVLGGLLLVLVPLLPSQLSEGTTLTRTASVVSRSQAIAADLRLFSTSPLFGQGMNLLGFIRPEHAAEGGSIVSHAQHGVTNSYLYLLVTTGVFGAMMFVLFYANVLKKIWHHPLILASIAVLGISGISDNTWFYPWIWWWFSYMLVFVTLQRE
jgi:hypothetical protein